MAFTILTDNGLAAFAAAQVAETFVDLTQLAVGDGNGADINPVSTMTALVNETWRGGLNRIYVSDTNANWLVIEALIPVDVGGWDIREVGVFAADGTMIGVGSYPLTTKPAAGSGSEKDLYVRMILEVTNAASVTQQIDPTLVYLTQWHLDEHADRTDDPHNTLVPHLAAVDPHPQYETPTEAQAKVNSEATIRANADSSHAALTAPHSATSAATASRLMLRDSSGRAKVAAPSAADDIAQKAQVDAEATTRANADSAHAELSAPHSATSAATASRLILRDSSGRAKVAAPSAADDIARLDTVNNAINALMNAPPSTLDTLNELAAALGDDPSFATTITNLIATKETPAGAQAKVDALASRFANSIGPSGHQQFPARTPEESPGLILQWAEVQSTSDVAQSFNWPVTFPRVCIGGWVNILGDTNITSNDAIEVISSTENTFTLDRDADMGTVTVKVYGIGN
ncbi:phage tail protein [uncultured Desulfuromusa sp.]|uniref:phage tail-collar fiber domain-containing protein n=1 Tax=uncultured Desulfuromusa sp. TaxID=219183 RepID=UPI002AA885C4|nr:phage tail protein [uncultured Desulfuromusa sp.]